MSVQRTKTNGSETGNAVGTPFPIDRETLLTIEDVAKLLRVPISWVYEHTRRRASDRIPGFRLGKYWRFREVDVLTWIERQRVES